MKLSCSTFSLWCANETRAAEQILFKKLKKKKKSGAPWFACSVKTAGVPLADVPQLGSAERATRSSLHW